jgi:hypothetical protein
VAKPDSTRAAIVAALRAAGASVVDHEGRKGEPDLVVGYRGRMWFVELKTPGKGNAERTTWHAQLTFAGAWQGPRVLVWTTVEQALRDIGAGDSGPQVVTEPPVARLA